MVTLNLTTTNKEENKIKNYLENNASEVLSEKINNGVRIIKDGKTLINKKTLKAFLKYACDEARKQVGKGQQFAQVDDDVVYGWAIHYFEEDSIEETLYNEDGTEYKPVMKSKPAVSTVKPIEVTPPKPESMTLFDLMDKPEETAGELVKISENLYADKDGVVHEIKQESDIFDLSDF